jgi:hypothetical protein
MAVLAFIILAQGAMAVSTAFGGSNAVGSASLVKDYDMGLADSAVSTASLGAGDGVSLSEAGLVDAIGGKMEETWEWQNDLKTLTVITKAKIEDSASYTFKKGGVVSPTHVEGYQTIKFNDAKGLAFSVVSRNDKGYVSSSELSAATASGNYKGWGSAERSFVKTTQSFSGETTNPAASSWGKHDAPVEDGIDGLLDDDEEVVDQYAQTLIAATGFKGHFSGSSSSGTIGATASETASFSEFDEFSLYSIAGKGIIKLAGMYGFSDLEKMVVAATGGSLGKRLTYNSIATSNSEQDSVKQKSSIGYALMAGQTTMAKTDSKMMMDNAVSYSYVPTGAPIVGVNFPDGSILASLSATTEAILKKDGTATINSGLRLKGGHIVRQAYVTSLVSPKEAYQATCAIGIFYIDDIPSGQSSLTGSSKMVASKTGASIISSWRVKVAKDLSENPNDSFTRQAVVFSMTGRSQLSDARKTADKTWSNSFVEKAIADSKTTLVA